MLEAARGWLTPAVLFVAMNLVIATIAVASRLVSSSAPGGDEAAAGEWRGLLRAPSLAVDRLRSSFSFSRLGLAADHAQAQRLFGDDGAAEYPYALQQQQPTATAETNQLESETEHEREAARVERSRSEAAAEAPSTSRRRPRARRTRRATAQDDLNGEEEAGVVEVDARADDFIRRFREQLRLQRLDSILRYRDRDTLRRTGTA